MQRYLVRGQIERAHSLSMTVNPWTVNTPKFIIDLLQYQVQSIITDNLTDALLLKAEYQRIQSNSSATRNMWLQS